MKEDTGRFVCLPPVPLVNLHKKITSEKRESVFAFSRFLW